MGISLSRKLIQLVEEPSGKKFTFRMDRTIPGRLNLQLTSQGHWGPENYPARSEYLVKITF